MHFDRGVVRLSGVAPGVIVRRPLDGDEAPSAKPVSRRHLLRAIETALIRERAVETGEVTVTAARDGSVTLTGDVRSPQDKRRAGQVARSVRGVATLDNRLSVYAAAEQPGWKIESEIEQRLKSVLRLGHAFVHVGVANGMVTLYGAVSSAAEKRQAVEAAWVAGVRHVEASKLNVEAWAQRKAPADVRAHSRYQGSKADQVGQLSGMVPVRSLLDLRKYRTGLFPSYTSGVPDLAPDDDPDWPATVR